METTLASSLSEFRWRCNILGEVGDEKCAFRGGGISFQLLTERELKEVESTKESVARKNIKMFRESVFGYLEYFQNI